MKATGEDVAPRAFEAEGETAVAGEGLGLQQGGIARAARFRKRTLTISVEGAVLRAVAFSGRSVLAWARLDLDDADVGALPTEFGPFVRGRARHVIDLPFYASLVRFLERPAVRRHYLDQVVRMEVGATIPFAEGEVDLRWKRVGRGRTSEVMAWVVPRWETDAYVDLVRVVDACPAAAYPKAAALALAAGLADGIVAHLAEGGVELVLVLDGVPRRVHRAELPPAPEDAGEYAGALAQAVDELCAWSGPPREDGDPQTLPIVLTGDVPTDAARAEALSEALGERLRALELPVEYPAGFPAVEYATNVGLALADWGRRQAPWRRTRARQAVVDLLPERHRRRRVPVRVLAVAALFVALTAGAVATTAVANDVVAWAHTLETRVATLQRLVRVDTIAAARENGLRMQLAIVEEQTEALELQERTSRESVALLLERFRLLTDESPGPAVSVSGVSLAGGKVRLAGHAPTYQDVIRFADSVRAAGLFTDIQTTDAAGEAAAVPADSLDASAAGVAFNMIGTYGLDADQKPVD